MAKKFEIVLEIYSISAFKIIFLGPMKCVAGKCASKKRSTDQERADSQENSLRIRTGKKSDSSNLSCDLHTCLYTLIQTNKCKCVYKNIKSFI